MKTDVATIYIKATCTECNGDGKIEIGPICFKPASQCCGGCYQTECCTVCNGNGEVEISFTEYDLYDITSEIMDNSNSVQAMENLKMLITRKIEGNE